MTGPGLLLAGALAALAAPAAPRCGIAGESFDACGSCVEEAAEESLALLRPVLAAPAHRRWHRAWHQTRSGISRELLQGDPAEFIRRHGRGGELSGEDFLYMHRRMLKDARRAWGAAGKPCIAGWASLPASIDDPAWPLPLKPVEKGDARAHWQGQLDWVRANDGKLRDPAYLKAASLNKLSLDVELYVHNVLHLLYSEPVSRCAGDDDASPACDDLMPAWSSPLNKHFWKIHGYVDDFVGVWLSAHGYSEIAEDCAGRAGCYQWRGTWTGNGHSHL